MFETLIALLAAHLVADFVAQTDALVQRKKHWPGMVEHIAWVVAFSALALASFNLFVLGTILVTHTVMDVIKARWLKGWVKSDLKSFGLDQVVHLAVIFGLAVRYPSAAHDGWWGTHTASVQATYYALLAGLSGLVVAVPAGGIVIGMAIERFQQAVTGSSKGMPAAGRYIGWLERGLIFIFMLNNQPEGVGLMLAAKSILRFGDVAGRDAERAHTEYVIIGTLLSFGWALVAAILAKAAIAHWA